MYDVTVYVQSGNFFSTYPPTAATEFLPDDEQVIYQDKGQYDVCFDAETGRPSVDGSSGTAHTNVCQTDADVVRAGSGGVHACDPNGIFVRPESYKDVGSLESTFISNTETAPHGVPTAWVCSGQETQATCEADGLVAAGCKWVPEEYEWEACSCVGYDDDGDGVEDSLPHDGTVYPICLDNAMSALNTLDKNHCERRGTSFSLDNECTAGCWTWWDGKCTDAAQVVHPELTTRDECIMTGSSWEGASCFNGADWDDLAVEYNTDGGWLLDPTDDVPTAVPAANNYACTGLTAHFWEQQEQCVSANGDLVTDSTEWAGCKDGGCTADKTNAEVLCESSPRIWEVVDCTIDDGAGVLSAVPLPGSDDDEGTRTDDEVATQWTQAACEGVRNSASTWDGSVCATASSVFPPYLNADGEAVPSTEQECTGLTGNQYRGNPVVADTSPGNAAHDTSHPLSEGLAFGICYDPVGKPEYTGSALADDCDGYGTGDGCLAASSAEVANGNLKKGRGTMVNSGALMTEADCLGNTGAASAISDVDSGRSDTAAIIEANAATTYAGNSNYVVSLAGADVTIKLVANGNQYYFGGSCWKFADSDVGTSTSTANPEKFGPLMWRSSDYVAATPSDCDPILEGTGAADTPETQSPCRHECYGAATPFNDAEMTLSLVAATVGGADGTAMNTFHAGADKQIAPTVARAVGPSVVAVADPHKYSDRGFCKSSVSGILESTLDTLVACENKNKYQADATSALGTPSVRGSCQDVGAVTRSMDLVCADNAESPCANAEGCTWTGTACVAADLGYDCNSYLVFTSTNWNTWQTLVSIAVEDDEDETLSKTTTDADASDVGYLYTSRDWYYNSGGANLLDEKNAAYVPSASLWSEPTVGAGLGIALVGIAETPDGIFPHYQADAAAALTTAVELSMFDTRFGKHINRYPFTGSSDAETPAGVLDCAADPAGDVTSPQNKKIHAEDGVTAWTDPHLLTNEQFAMQPVITNGGHVDEPQGYLDEPHYNCLLAKPVTASAANAVCTDAAGSAGRGAASAAAIAGQVSTFSPTSYATQALTCGADAQVVDINLRKVTISRNSCQATEGRRWYHKQFNNQVNPTDLEWTGHIRGEQRTEKPSKLPTTLGLFTSGGLGATGSLDNSGTVAPADLWTSSYVSTSEVRDLGLSAASPNVDAGLSVHHCARVVSDGGRDRGRQGIRRSGAFDAARQRALLL
jgi:hypothetical protein